MWLLAQFEIVQGLTIPAWLTHAVVAVAAAWLMRSAGSRFPWLMAKTPQQILQELLDQQKKLQG